MITDKKHVQQLASLLSQKGITSVVISPGSRNAPLINIFSGLPEFSCLNIIDERSAGYTALGMALAQEKPVAVVCTSGTAAINYGPAIAEAYYQNIPLVVLTADRPRRWIDQADGQTVRQENLFANHIRKSVSLQESDSDNDFILNNLLINEALNLAFSSRPGPVHINIPLDEPLYGLTESKMAPFRNIQIIKPEQRLPHSEINILSEQWNSASRKMVIIGQHSPNEELNNLVSQLAEDPGTIIFAEHITNLSTSHLLKMTDPVIAAIPDHLKSGFQCDILLTFGNQIVSKRLKQFVRHYQPVQHWHVSVGAGYTDTYNSLSHVIATDALEFLNAFVPEIKITASTYREMWITLERTSNQCKDSFLKDAPFCDLTACQLIASRIPEDSVVHFGNSSVVRLIQMFSPIKNVSYFGNRGTSGIDGSLSTAVGFALSTGKTNTVILGELSYFYDSNALMNNYFPKNLRIIVLNNGGGNIFRLIGGPRQSPALKKHFVAEHDFKAEGLAVAFGISYLKAENRFELTETLNTIYAPDFSGPVILEVLTNGELSAQVFQNCFEQIRG